MRRQFYLSASGLLAVAVGCADAWANPRGGSVAAGSATIVSSAPSRLDVNQSSDRVIVNWQGFSIDPGEITRFNQPSSTATALNRVVGGDPTQILGQLSANGRILIINPNGVLFGAGSRVDVAGLIATTANLSDNDFMARRLNFALPSGAPTASVVNRGTITVADGGVVALVAPGVSNEGVIHARLGRVSLVSADRFTVDFHGDRLIQFALDDKVTRATLAPDGAALTAAVANSGRIVANGGSVQMSANVASGVLDRAIDMSGVVQARTARRVDGAIVLDGGEHGTVQVSGLIDATGRRTGQTGGSVRILGEHVGLFAGARVDASGDAGGGTVLVGGNRQGQGPERTAQATYVDKNASIAADAISTGDGGRVVVWSDQYTRFDGTITARGGAQGGNGGQIETSSHGNLQATGRVDASAPAGKAGQWLLDPTDVTITNVNNNDPNAGGIFNPTGTIPAQIDAATISAVLSGGTDVTINTGGAAGQPGSITVLQPITSNSLTPRTITFNAGTGPAANFSASADITGTNSSLAVNVFVDHGSYTNSANITTNGGALSVTAVNGYTASGNVNTGIGAVTVNSGGGYTQSGAINTNGGNLSITAGAAVSIGDVSVNAGSITVTTTGAVSQTGSIIQTGAAGTFSISAGANPITLGSANQIAAPVSLTNSGANAVSLNVVGHLTLGGVTVGSGAVTLTATTGMGQSGGALNAFTQAAGAGLVTLTGGAGFVDISNTLNQLTGPVRVSNSGGGGTSVNIRNTGALTIASANTSSSNFILTAGGSITQTGPITTAGPLIVASTVANADILLGTQANNIVGPVTVGALGAPASNIRDFALRNVNAGAAAPNLSTLTNLRNLTLQFDSTAVVLGTGGNSTIRASGAITLGSSVSLAAATTLDTTGGGSSGGNIAINGPLTGAGQTLTMNAGGAGDISLQGIGTAGAPLATITVTNAHNLTASGLVATNAFTQSAGSGTTNFVGPGLSSAGAVALTTGAVFGTYNVGSFTVTSGQTVATGTIAGVSGGAAAVLASDPGSSGTQTFNGCAIGVGCGGGGAGGGGGGSGPTPGQVATATTTARQVISAFGQQSDDPNQNAHGFEVQIPTQNIDWSDPAGDLRIKLAPEYQPLSRFFYAGESSNRFLYGSGRSSR